MRLTKRILGHCRISLSLMLLMSRNLKASLRTLKKSKSNKKPSNPLRQPTRGGFRGAHSGPGSRGRGRFSSSRGTSRSKKHWCESTTALPPIKHSSRGKNEALCKLLGKNNRQLMAPLYSRRGFHSRRSLLFPQHQSSFNSWTVQHWKRKSKSS